MGNLLVTKGSVGAVSRSTVSLTHSKTIVAERQRTRLGDVPPSLTDTTSSTLNESVGELSSVSQDMRKCHYMHKRDILGLLSAGEPMICVVQLVEALDCTGGHG